jgi:integrase
VPLLHEAWERDSGSEEMGRSGNRVGSSTIVKGTRTRRWRQRTSAHARAAARRDDAHAAQRILKAAEERGQQVDRAIYGIRIAKADEREPRVLSWEEAEELQSWMPEYISRIVPVAILTMLRRAELLGLRDGDIDSAAGSVAVFSKRQEGERVQTKTRAGCRTVDVGPRALALLREQQLARSPRADGYLFPAPEGGPFDGDNCTEDVR